MNEAPHDLERALAEEPRQTERKNFDQRMTELAEQINIPKDDLMATYALEEKNARDTNPEDPTTIYESGQGSQTVEHLIKESIINKVMAGRDSLTGINNRVSFDQELERRRKEVKKHGEFSLIMIDIDKFKDVNDHYGHQAGDYVLREVAKILKDSMRQGDLLARYGGEEIMIITPNTNGSAVDFAERLRRVVEEKLFKYENDEIKVTISAGVSPYNEDLQKMKIDSDRALYLAKDPTTILMNDEAVEAGHINEETRNQVWYFDAAENKFKKKITKEKSGT